MKKEDFIGQAQISADFSAMNKDQKTEMQEIRRQKITPVKSVSLVTYVNFTGQGR